MRDSKRIDRFCNELKSVWRIVPDWRFGQLMSNMLGAFSQKTEKDFFFAEDEELMEFFIQYICESTPYVRS